MSWNSKIYKGKKFIELPGWIIPYCTEEFISEMFKEKYGKRVWKWEYNAKLGWKNKLQILQKWKM